MILAPLLLLSYLIGAFPTAVLVGKISKGIDIREHGSGNAGGTNAFRVLGWKAGTLVSIVDLGKGALAAKVIASLPLGPLPVEPVVVAILCGLFAVIGHVFPIYVGFKGGKGVATGAGMLLTIAPIPVGVAVVVFVSALLLTGWVSLGSLLGASTIPLSMVLLDRYTAFHYHPLLLWLTVSLALFVLFTHRKNIRDLIRGQERSFPHLRLFRR